MKYSYETTINHKVSTDIKESIEFFDNLILNEGFSEIPFFEKNNVVINLDYAENQIATFEKRELNKSMDLAFGLKDYSTGKEVMLLVELKFRMTDFYYLKKEHLEEKVFGSRKILSETPPIYNQFIFIVQTNKIQEAISRLYRMVPKLDSKYVILDLDTLKSEFF